MKELMKWLEKEMLSASGEVMKMAVKGSEGSDLAVAARIYAEGRRDALAEVKKKLLAVQEPEVKISSVSRVNRATFLHDDPDDYLSDEMIPVHYLRRFDVHGVISGDHFLSTMTDEEFKAAVDKRIAKRSQDKKEGENPNDPFPES